MPKRLLWFYTLIVLINGCSNLSRQENTETPAPLVEFTPSLTLKILWTANAGGGTDKSYLKLAPAFYHDQLFTASPKGLLRAFTLTDGKMVWEQQIDTAISGGPGVGEGLVLIGSHKGEVIALSEIDGTELWRTQVSSEVLAKPQINQGIVVVRTVDGKLFGLESKTGERLWVYERSRVPLLSLRGTGAPIIKQDIIIAGFDNGKMAALELHKGQVLWEIPVAVPRGRSELERMVDIDADPLLMDNIIYVTSYQGRTVAIDLFKGELLWEKKLSSYTGLGVDSNHLYISDTHSHVWALDRYSGDNWWKQDKLQARDVTSPVSIGNYVVVGDQEGYLHWMRRDDGQFVARQRLGKASILVPPLVVNKTLVAYDSRGEIVALQAEEN